METKKPLHVEVFTVPLHEPTNRILTTPNTTPPPPTTITQLDTTKKERKDVHIVFKDKNLNTTSALSLPPQLPLSQQVPSSGEVSRRSMSDTEVSQADSTWIDVDQHDGVAIKTSSSLSSAGERGSEDGVYITTGTAATHTAPARSQDSADTWRLVDSDKTDSHTTTVANTTAHQVGTKPTVINTKPVPPPPTTVTSIPSSSAALAPPAPTDDRETASSKKMSIYTLETNAANGIPSKILSYRFEQSLLLNIMKANTGMYTVYIVYVYIYLYCYDVYYTHAYYICVLSILNIMYHIRLYPLYIGRLMYDALLDWSGTGDTPSHTPSHRGPSIGATPTSGLGGSGIAQGTGVGAGTTGDDKGMGVNKTGAAPGQKVPSSTASSSLQQYKQHQHSQKQEGGGDGLLVEENPIFFNI